MAVIEGLAWGYFASGFSQQYAVVLMWTVGILIGLMIWGLDYTLMSHDTKSHHYKQHIYGKHGEVDSNSQAATRFALLKYLARIGLAVLSMWLTAPSLSQLVFHSDIEQKIRQAQEKAISDIHQKITHKHQRVVDLLQQQDIDLGQQLISEVAGRVGSRIKGEGATARNIKVQQASVKKQLVDARAAMVLEVDELNEAIRLSDRDKLAKKWGVQFNADTTHERQSRLDELKITPEYQEVKIRIYGGLLFLLLALISMKLMQGKGLELYFSEFMQEQWQRYRNGAFDAWLEPADCSTALHSIPPSRFEYLMLNGYSREMSSVEERHERLDAMRKRQEAEEEAIHRRKLEDAEYQRQRQREQENEARQAEQLAQQQQILEESRIKRKQSGATALADLGQLRDTLEGLIDQKQHAQDELDNIRRQIDSLNREIAAAPDNLATVEETLASQMAEEQLAKSLLSQARAGHQRTDIERMKLLTDLHASYTHIADNKEQTYAKLNDLKATQELYDGQLKKLQSKERDLDTQIKGLKSQLEDVQHSQQKVINRMKADAELLGLAEFTSPIFEKEAAS